MSREIKKPSLIVKLKTSNRNKVSTNIDRLTEISKDEFLDIPRIGSDRSSTGSYSASCFASPLRSRKFKKPEVEKLQKVRIEHYYQNPSLNIQEVEENIINGEMMSGSNTSDNTQFKKMRRSNTVELNIPKLNSTEKVTPTKKSLLQRSHSFLSRLGSKSPKKKQNNETQRKINNSPKSPTANQKVNFELGSDWGHREIRESLSRALEGSQVCHPVDSMENPNDSASQIWQNEQSWKKPSQFFPSFPIHATETDYGQPEEHHVYRMSSLPSHLPQVEYLPTQSACTLQVQHPPQIRCSPQITQVPQPPPLPIHLNNIKYETRLSDISEESHASDGVRKSKHSNKQENFNQQQATPVVEHRRMMSDDLVRRNPTNKIIPPRPSSVQPGNIPSDLNYFLTPSNHHQKQQHHHHHSRMNKSHSATFLRSSVHAEDIVQCQGHMSRLTSEYQTRSQNEASRMSSCASDSGSPASSGVGSCKELRSTLPIVRSPNRSMEKTLGQVFLTYNEETKKYQLPNEITSMDTLKALFVRAFPRHLTMQWFDNPLKKIYILDRVTGVYYEIDDFREVVDRCQLKIYEFDSILLSPSRGQTSTTQPSRNIPHESTSNQQNIRSLCETEDNLNRSGGAQRHSVPCFPTLEKSSSSPTPSSVTSSLPPSLSSSSAAATSVTSTSAMTTTMNRGGVEMMSCGNSVNSSGTITPLNGFIQDASERERMRKMEAQLANLSALVQSISTNVQPINRQSITSNTLMNNNTNNNNNDINSINNVVDLNSASFSNLVSPTNGKKSSLPPSRVNNRYCGLSRKVRDLRKELNQIRQLQVNFMNSIRFSLQHLMRHCKDSAVTNQPIIFELSNVRLWLEKYKQESIETGNGLRDLEFLVEELRCDVINRKCKVNPEEVEGFAMCLSYLSRSLANLKSEFPKLNEETRKATSEEMDTICVEERFLSEEPSRLEKSLRQTKKLMSVLYTLKKLSMLQANQKIDIPTVEAKVELAEVDRKILLANIESIQPDHDMRAINMEKSMRARELRKRIHRKVEKMKSENHLRSVHKNLRSTNNFEINLRRAQTMLIHLYEQQLANGGKRVSYDAQEELQKQTPPRNVPEDETGAGMCDDTNGDSQKYSTPPPTTASHFNMNGNIQPASSIKQSQLARFRAIHDVTSPPIKRSAMKLTTPTKRLKDGVASETDASSFEINMGALEESESEESCCSISTIKRATKVKDSQQRSSVISIESSSATNHQAGLVSPLVLTPPSTLSPTIITIPPSSTAKSNPPVTTTTFCKSSHSKSLIPSTKQGPPPVPVRKTSTLSKNSSNLSSSPLYSNIQELKKKETNKGSIDQNDGRSKEHPMVKETHFGVTDGDVDDVAGVSNQRKSVTIDSQVFNKKTTNGRTSSNLRVPPTQSSKIDPNPRKRPSPTSQQEGILVRSAQKVTGSRSSGSKNVKFKPDGNKCEETEIN